MPDPRPNTPGNDSPVNGWSRTPVEHTFTASSEIIPQARRLLVTWLEGCGFDGAAVDLELAVSEIVTNAVVHGKGPVQLTLARLPDRVRVEVHDHGGGHPAIRAIESSGANPGGWGLRMVDQLVDRWGTHTTGGHTTVWLEKVLPASS